MAWVWTRLGLIGMAAAVPILIGAWVVYKANPRGLQNRLLTIILVLAGAISGTSYGLMYFTTDANTARAFQAAGLVGSLAAYLLYPAFLSTLRTPLARPIERLRPAFYVLAASIPLLWPWIGDAFIAGMVPGKASAWELDPGFGVKLAVVWSILVGILGLVLSISAFRHAPIGTLRRAQARAYLFAFALLDLSIILLGAFQVAVLQLQGGFEALLQFVEAMVIFSVVTFVAFLFLLVYGMLTTQLFDLHVTIRRGAARTAVVGFVAASFFVVNQLTERFLSLDGLLPGLLAAGLLALGFLRLQRLVLRFLDRLVPVAPESPAQRLERKKEMYKEALNELAADGRISEADRHHLARLRARLGLPS